MTFSIEGISAAIAGLAAVAAIVSSIFARKQAKESSNSALLAQNEATRVSLQSRDLQALDWASQYFEGVRSWSDEVVYAISEAMHLSRFEDGEQRAKEWNRVRARLSRSIDTGRWYFPNNYETGYGTHKPPAYRGIRRKVLDHISDAYLALPEPPKLYTPDKNNDSYTMAAYEKLEHSKRMFVSEIQEVLNPRHREAQVDLIVQRFKITEKMRSPSDFAVDE